MNIPDNKILAACIVGDDKAWNEFLSKYSPMVFSAIYSTLKRQSFHLEDMDIQDLQQQIILSLIEHDYKKLKQYRGINNCSFSTWLWIVSVRNTINFIKKTSRENKLKAPAEILDKLAGLDGIREEFPGQKEELKVMAGVIRNHLKPREQLFLRLHFEKELGTEEVARILKLSPNAVYVLKKRVLHKINEIFCKKNKAELSK